MLSLRTRAALVLSALVAGIAVTSAPATASPSPVDATPPGSITVCRSNGGVDRVPFPLYVKEVLADEFPSSWPTATLQAGAVAIRSYAWYYVEHPYRPGTCDIGDTTRHQAYEPGDSQYRTARTDAAVDATWTLRLEEVRDGEVTPAFAQYCASCGGFASGEHMNQYTAYNQGADGWSTSEILLSAYRNKDGLRLYDWREGFALDIHGAAPHRADPDTPLRLTAGVAGVGGGDRRAGALLSVTCTTDAGFDRHVLQSTGVTSTPNGPRVFFDRAYRVGACREHEVAVTAELRVNSYLVASHTVAVWRPWESASDRRVARIAPNWSRVNASIDVSRRIFADRGDTPGRRRRAKAVVIARSDAFPDALAATGLAGRTAPILLNPGGDAPLARPVWNEIDRILPRGATVHIVGGPVAISTAVQRDPRLRHYRVVRHWGEDRIGTASEVANALRASGVSTSTVVVARAYPDDSSGWADAIAVGPYAAARRRPVLLTRTGSLSAATERWIEAAPVEEAVLVGGPAAVPADAGARLDVRTTRVAGATRDGTAGAIANTLWRRRGRPNVRAAMVIDAYDARDWAYGLVAAVYAANRGTPQLIVGRMVPRRTTGAWLDARPRLPVVVAGGRRTVTIAVARDLAGD